jgi:hypothetical protein
MPHLHKRTAEEQRRTERFEVSASPEHGGALTFRTDNEGTYDDPTRAQAWHLLWFIHEASAFQ